MRTSSATTASGRSGARSPRSRSGARARAGESRSGPGPSADVLLRVRDPEVDRLDRARVAELACEHCVEAGARHVQVALVGRDLGTHEDLAVADGAVSDEREAGDVEVARPEHV